MKKICMIKLFLKLKKKASMMLNLPKQIIVYYMDITKILEILIITIVAKILMQTQITFPFVMMRIIIIFIIIIPNLRD